MAIEKWTVPVRNTDLDLFAGGEIPRWLKTDIEKQPLSQTPTKTVLTIAGTDETLTLPVLTSTTVYEVKCMIGTKIGSDPGVMKFVTKQGCTWKAQLDHEEVRRNITIRGIPSFKRPKHKWPHSHAIIGAGHTGLRQAIYWLKYKEENFVIYDRHSTVGGMAWHDQANKTSKLQTELGTYHLQYDEANPPPKIGTWPSRDELLQHFHDVSMEYGVMPYIKFQTDVRTITVEKGGGHGGLHAGLFGGNEQSYRFALKDLATKKKADEEVTHSSVCLYPGNLTVPRREDYKGEDDFDGPIAYAIQDSFDYSQIKGKPVTVVGHGAFAVENIRTCIEYDCPKIYLVCRRRNLACPRVMSWFVNQSHVFISAALFLNACKPMYDLIPIDPWTYHSVFADEKRSRCQVTQKARFGIGDVYFLTIAMGVTEVVDDTVKRLSRHRVHGESGNSWDSNFILKLLGFVGHWDNDKLMGLKEMNGFWVNGDCRRFLKAEAIGVNASNFAVTSFSPGCRIDVATHAHFMWYPKDFQILLESNMMPKWKGNVEEDRPAYVIDARHATMTGMYIGQLIPGMAEDGEVTGPLKRRRQLECHPVEKFLEECKADWDQYAVRMAANGAPKPPVPYPYTMQNLRPFLVEERDELCSRWGVPPEYIPIAGDEEPPVSA